jgi:hypothetical protein
MPATPSLSPRWLLTGRIVLTVLVAGYVFRRVDWSGLHEALRLTDPVKIVGQSAFRAAP